VRPGRALAVAALLLAAACGTPTAALRVDVEAYLAKAETWAAVEGETARTIQRILETEFVDEALVLQHINEATPRLEAHLAAIRAYKPATRSVADVHAVYISSWGALLTGFQAIELGFRTGNWARLAEGRNGMGEWRDGLVRVASELRHLVELSGASPASTRAI